MKKPYEKMNSLTDVKAKLKEIDRQVVISFTQINADFLKFKEEMQEKNNILKLYKETGNVALLKPFIEESKTKRAVPKRGRPKKNTLIHKKTSQDLVHNSRNTSDVIKTTSSISLVKQLEPPSLKCRNDAEILGEVCEEYLEDNPKITRNYQKNAIKNERKSSVDEEEIDDRISDVIFTAPDISIIDISSDCEEQISKKNLSLPAAGNQSEIMKIQKILDNKFFLKTTVVLEKIDILQLYNTYAIVNKDHFIKNLQNSSVIVDTEIFNGNNSISGEKKRNSETRESNWNEIKESQAKSSFNGKQAIEKSEFDETRFIGTVNLNETQVIEKPKFNETRIIEKPYFDETRLIEKANINEMTRIIEKSKFNESRLMDKTNFNESKVVNKANCNETKTKANTDIKEPGVISIKRKSCSESLTEVSLKNKKKKTCEKEIFNPYEKTPIKQKIAAFERAAKVANATPSSRISARPKTHNKENIKRNKRDLFNSTKEKCATPYKSPSLTKISSAIKSSRRDFLELEKRRKDTEDEALRKKEAKLKAQIEEKRKKREEKELKVRQHREVLEKDIQKQAEAMRIKEEKYKLLLAHRKEKLLKQKEEAEKRRQLVKQKHEAKKREEERILMEDLALQKKEEEAEKLKQTQENMKKEDARLKQLGINKKYVLKQPLYLRVKAPLLPTYDCYDSDDDKTQHAAILRPSWTYSSHLHRQLKVMSFIDSKLRNTLFYPKPQSPDLSRIFQDIDPNRLRRNSSAVWNTSPNFTMMEIDDF